MAAAHGVPRHPSRGETIRKRIMRTLRGAAGGGSSGQNASGSAVASQAPLPGAQHSVSARTNKLLERVNHPNFWQRFRAKLPNNDVPIGAKGIAVRDLKDHLKSLGNSNEANQARVDALREVAQHLPHLAPAECGVAVRAVCRFLAVQDLAKSAEIVERDIPEIVRAAYQGSTASPILSAGDRVDILQEMLAVRNPPLPSAVMSTVLRIGLLNYDEIYQDGMSAPAIRLLGCLVDAAHSVPMTTYPSTLGAELETSRQEIAFRATEVFGRAGFMGVEPGQRRELTNLKERCMSAMRMFSGEQWSVITEFEESLPEYPHDGRAARYVQGPLGNGSQDRIEPAP